MRGDVEPGLWGGEDREGHGAERGKQSIWLTNPLPQAQAESILFFNQRCLLKGAAPAAPSAHIGSTSLRAVVHTRGLYLHGASLGVDV